MYKIIFKRVLDICFSLIALIFLSPLLILVIFILLFTGEHEIFYFQKRIGKGLKFFSIWKFATMMKNSENMGHGIITIRNDPRVLPFGKFLRKTKINELPQLVNVLIGEMSIVGPRPLIYNPYKDDIGMKVYSVKPGLTGIGSIVFRDEEKLLSETSLDKKVFYDEYLSPYKGELELWYQSNLSFYVDFMLIFLTAWVILVPNSDLVYKVFKDLPPKPSNLLIKEN